MTKQGRVNDYLVKWRGLDYGEATWEHEFTMLEDDVRPRVWFGWGLSAGACLPIIADFCR
jgi:hypothetical protein